MVDCRAVVDDLDQGVVFVGYGGVKDVDQAVGGGGEESRRGGWVEMELGSKINQSAFSI